MNNLAVEQFLLPFSYELQLKISPPSGIDLSQIFKRRGDCSLLFLFVQFVFHGYIREFGVDLISLSLPNLADRFRFICNHWKEVVKFTEVWEFVRNLFTVLLVIYV